MKYEDIEVVILRGLQSEMLSANRKLSALSRSHAEPSELIDTAGISVLMRESVLATGSSQRMQNSKQGFRVLESFDSEALYIIGDSVPACYCSASPILRTDTLLRWTLCFIASMRYLHSTVCSRSGRAIALP